MKKRVLFLGLICLNISLLLSGCIDLNSIGKDSYGSCETYDSSINLTMEQKLEDFEQYYELICREIPFLDETSELYGIDFKSRKDLYKERILETDSDIEFYAVMESISCEICSFHTRIILPKEDYLKTFQCNNDDLLERRATIKRQNAWENEIKKAIMEFEAKDLILLRQIDGRYYVCNEFLDEKNENYSSRELIEINGQIPEEFFRTEPFLYELYYDYIDKKCYRESVFLNKKSGKKMDLKWLDQTGKIYEEILYYSYEGELAGMYGYLYSDKLSFFPQNEKAIYRFDDDNNNITYIRVPTFEAKGKELSEMLSQIEYEDVIIDLRNNHGGFPYYGVKYIYPFMFSDNRTFVERWKSSINMGKDSFITMKINNIKRVDNDDQFIYFSRETEGIGKASAPKKLVLLTNQKTGSAADFFVGIIKENALGVVIGDITGGEGKSGTMTCEMLNNSGILFTYYPSVPCDEEGEALYYPGVIPDIYVSWNQEEYDKRSIFRKEGTSEEYINMLEYDPVLNAAIEYFGKEGTQ